MKTYVKLAGTAILTCAIAGAAGIYLPALADNGGSTKDELNFQIPVDAQVAQEIQSRLAGAVNNAMTRNGYDGLVASFDRATRSKFGDEKDPNLDELNSRIEQFRQDFMDIYSEDFSFKADDLGDVAMYHGSDADYVMAQLDSIQALNASDAAGDMRPSSPIILVRERMPLGNGWQIVIKENVSGSQLRDALSSKLAAITNDKTAWPSDVHEAYATFAGQILHTITQTSYGNLAADKR